MNPEIVYKYFPDLTPEQKIRFERLGSLYAEWNQKINVISRKDIDTLYERHVLHSLAIAKYLAFPDGSRILDVGTGGGFPGIPLAILFPACEFVLVDSIGKKMTVVRAIADALKLVNVEAEHARVETLNGKFDFIVSRAVAPAAELYKWTHRLISDAPERGWLFLKGGDLKEELSALKKRYVLKDLTEWFDEPFFETKKLIHIP
jgi:16S rRNA (guanine527-N7)-methyltransferase